MPKKIAAKVDQIIDELVEDEAIKAELRSKIHAQNAPKSTAHPQSQTQETSDTSEDLWDNLPI